MVCKDKVNSFRHMSFTVKAKDIVMLTKVLTLVAVRFNGLSLDLKPKSPFFILD